MRKEFVGHLFQIDGKLYLECGVCGGTGRELDRENSSQFSDGIQCWKPCVKCEGGFIPLEKVEGK